MAPILKRTLPTEEAVALSTGDLTGQHTRVSSAIGRVDVATPGALELWGNAYAGAKSHPLHNDELDGEAADKTIMAGALAPPGQTTGAIPKAKKAITEERGRRALHPGDT